MPRKRSKAQKKAKRRERNRATASQAPAADDSPQPATDVQRPSTSLSGDLKPQGLPDPSPPAVRKGTDKPLKHALPFAPEIIDNIAFFMADKDTISMSQVNAALRRQFLPRHWKSHYILVETEKSLPPKHLQGYIIKLDLDFNLDRLAQDFEHYDFLWAELKDFASLQTLQIFRADWRFCAAAVTTFSALPELISFSFLLGAAWPLSEKEPSLPVDLTPSNIKDIEILRFEPYFEKMDGVPAFFPKAPPRDLVTEATFINHLLNNCRQSVQSIQFPAEYLSLVLGLGSHSIYPELKHVCLEGPYPLGAASIDDLFDCLRGLDLTHLETRFDPPWPELGFPAKISADPSTISGFSPSLQTLVLCVPTLRHPIFSHLPTSLTRLEIHSYNFPFTLFCHQLSEVTSWFATIECQHVSIFKVSFQIAEDSDVRRFTFDVGRAFPRLDLLLVHVAELSYEDAPSVSKAIAQGLHDAGTNLTRLHLMLEILNINLPSVSYKWLHINEFCLTPCILLLPSACEVITLSRTSGTPGFHLFNTEVEENGLVKLARRRYFFFTTEGSDHWWKRIENWHKDSTRIIDVEEPESPLTEDLMEDYFS